MVLLHPHMICSLGPTPPLHLRPTWTYSIPDTLTRRPLRSWACLALTASHCLLNPMQAISPLPLASALPFIQASLPSEPLCQLWVTIPHCRISRTFQNSSYSPAPPPPPACYQLLLSSTIRTPRTFSYLQLA